MNIIFYFDIYVNLVIIFFKIIVRNRRIDFHKRVFFKYILFVDSIFCLRKLIFQWTLQSQTLNSI